VSSPPVSPLVDDGADDARPAESAGADALSGIAAAVPGAAPLVSANAAAESDGAAPSA